MEKLKGAIKFEKLLKGIGINPDSVVYYKQICDTNPVHIDVHLNIGQFFQYTQDNENGLLVKLNVTYSAQNHYYDSNSPKRKQIGPSVYTDDLEFFLPYHNIQKT